MDIRQIRQVIEICRQGGIGRAARELGISQPALSRSIARIEDQLGAVLFERSGDGAKPTPFANYIVSRATMPMQSLAAIAHEVKMMVRGEAGRVRIGMGPVIRELMFMPMTKQILSAFPRLSLKASVSSMPELLRALTSRSIDIAISSSEHFAKEDADIWESSFVRTDLLTLNLSFFVRTDHEILKKSCPIQPEELLDYPMVGIGMTKEQRSHFPTKLGEVRRRNLGAYLVDDYALVREIVLNSAAIGYGPELVFCEDLKQRKISSVNLGFEIAHPCVALCLPETWHSPVVQKIVRIAQEVSAQLSEGVRLCLPDMAPTGV